MGVQRRMARPGAHACDDRVTHLVLAGNAGAHRTADRGCGHPAANWIAHGVVDGLRTYELDPPLVRVLLEGLDSRGSAKKGSHAMMRRAGARGG